MTDIKNTDIKIVKLENLNAKAFLPNKEKITHYACGHQDEISVLDFDLSIKTTNGHHEIDFDFGKMKEQKTPKDTALKLASIFRRMAECIEDNQDIF